jgi:N-acetylneuraminic acid mutarotase
MSWSTPLTTGPVPEPRSRHTCTALHTRLVFIGGGDQSRLFNDVHLYDCETREWSVVRAKGKAPSGRWGHSTTLVDSNKLFVFGGHDGKVRLNDLFILHLGEYLGVVHETRQY